MVVGTVGSGGGGGRVNFGAKLLLKRLTLKSKTGFTFLGTHNLRKQNTPQQLNRALEISSAML